ncbi:MAG TPA: type II toxin-antitoxin system VapC family toxin [Chloroflexia bacterium]
MSGPLRYPQVVVDASVWASIFMQQDINHAASLEWWQEYIGRGGLILAPEILLVEVSAAVGRRTQQPQLAAHSVLFLQRATGLQLVAVDTTLILDAADLAGRLQIRGADAIYVATARQKALPLVSWDNDQLERATILPHTFLPRLFLY